MKEFVGVRTPTSFGWHPSLKREALIFDRVGIFNFPYAEMLLEDRERTLNRDREETQFYAGEIKWLIRQGIVFSLTSDPDIEALNKEDLMSDEQYRRVNDKFNYLSGKTRDIVLSNSRKREAAKKIGLPEAPMPDEFFTTVEQQNFLWARMAALKLRMSKQVEACPIVTKPFFVRNLPAPGLAETSKNDVIQVVLRAIPVPSEAVSWEQIIEYRSDHDSQSKFLALRHWMSEMARAELNPAEVEEKLEHLIDQYQKHMRLHRMKTNVGTLETIITTGAEMLGDLFSFKWGKAAQALFSLKKREMALLEGELTAPGSEVAYIVKAKETFANE